MFYATAFANGLCKGGLPLLVLGVAAPAAIPVLGMAGVIGVCVAFAGANLGALALIEKHDEKE